MKAENVKLYKSNLKQLIFLTWTWLLLTVSTLSFANDDGTEIPHLCKEGEEVVFSCMTGKKYISFCATPRYTAVKGHMTYRIGVAGQPPEMEYPSRPMPVVKAFRVSALDVQKPQQMKSTTGSMYWRQQAAIKFQTKHAMTLPQGSYTEIAFQKGAYTYTFFYQITDWIYRGLYDGAGMVVERAGQEPVELLCNEREQAVMPNGLDSRFFPRRVGYLNAQIHSKTNFKNEAQWFRGVSPLNKDRSIELNPLRSE
ncbi:hypothetical protein B9Z39_08285 [Limnohabitans sp. JirII-29]|uniref:hypothetical protein n=1 Tax=Limnohabitans sp. JirII-29 TaxID=1835756 RepID=UPI000D3D0130|nr:hypothetical protein [Limnohabitans sp. JirII-29]PUE27739.1 hypothetical protein B9Z39_08285 [Limnohabitans sp. JirII-29]